MLSNTVTIAMSAIMAIVTLVICLLPIIMRDLYRYLTLSPAQLYDHIERAEKFDQVPASKEFGLLLYIALFSLIGIIYGLFKAGHLW